MRAEQNWNWEDTWNTRVPDLLFVFSVMRKTYCRELWIDRFSSLEDLSVLQASESSFPSKIERYNCTHVRFARFSVAVRENVAKQRRKGAHTHTVRIESELKIGRGREQCPIGVKINYSAGPHQWRHFCFEKNQKKKKRHFRSAISLSELRAPTAAIWGGGALMLIDICVLVKFQLIFRLWLGNWSGEALLQKTSAKTEIRELKKEARDQRLVCALRFLK